MKTKQTGRKSPDPRRGNVDEVTADPKNPRTGRCKRCRTPSPSTDARKTHQKASITSNVKKEDLQDSIVVARTSVTNHSGRRYIANELLNSVPSRKGQATSREEYLRADPYADVQSSTLVVCRLCGTKIKLSSKSTYGPNLWNRHIKRCRTNADEEIVPKANISAADTPGEKGSSPRKRLRVSPGTSPLKLKISRKTRSQDAVFPEKEIKVISNMSSSLSATEQATDSDSKMLPADGLVQSSVHQNPSSEQPLVSRDSATTPSDLHEESLASTVQPPSDTHLEEVQSSLLDHDKEMSEPELQWTDGLLTTSPQETVFEENLHSHGSATQIDAAGGGSAVKSDGRAVSIGPAKDQRSIPKQDREEKMQSDEVTSLESSPSAADTEDGSLTPQSSQITAHSSSPPPSPDTELDLDLEYPEWDPPSVVSTFEEELRKAGIFLDNAIGSHNLVGDEVKSLPHEASEALPRMVAI
ncbi:hypothetical protein ACEPAI_4101 [Sanghuangporus weigelae]